MNKMRKFLCVATVIFLGAFITISSAPSAFAKCIGLVPVWGTGDTKETCKSKKHGIQPEEKPETTTNNDGVGSGTHNTNVILGALTGENTKKDADEVASYNALKPSIHQIRLEMAVYMIPSAYQFDTPGMPERSPLPNGVAYEYYLNPSLAFGIAYQQLAKSGGRSFDPISYADASGDTHVIGYPGALDRLKYTSYIPYVALNAKLAQSWYIGGRFGIGRVEIEAEFNGSDRSGSKKYIDNTSMMVDLYVEKWFRGVRAGAGLRYIMAQNDTADYLEYMNMGSAQVMIHFQWTLETFGLL